MVASSRRLSILMVCPQFYPLVGGYERAAERMSQAMIARGHRVTVLAERRHAAWSIDEIHNGVHIKRWWCVYKPHWHIFTSLLGFVWAVLREGVRYDVIHVHQYGYHAATSVILGKLLKIPVLLKLTNTKEMGLAASLNNARLTRITALLHRQVDACIATTKESFEEAERFGIDRKRLHVIGNGIDTDHFMALLPSEKAEMKRTLGMKPGPMVLFVGRLSHEKNPLGLLDAWETVIKKYPTSQLALVGDGPLLKALNTRIKASDSGASVIIAGQQEDVLKWYQAADIFVMASLHEGLSNSLLEALSCGLPVVSTRVSGSVDAIERGLAGELVNVGDMEGLAVAILKLLEDQAYRAFCGANGRRFVLGNYSQGLITNSMESLYFSLCHTKKVKYR